RFPAGTKIVGIASLWILFLTKNRPKRNKYNGVSYLIPFTKILRQKSSVFLVFFINQD
ncbi:MAG: hypothetical protein ACI81T_003272, partial [Bacteroidia bacterium]